MRELEKESGHDPTMNGGASESASWQGKPMPPPSGGGRERSSLSAPTLIDPEQRHDNGRKVRIDALPEHLAYRDDGCDLAPSCLRCPLVRCRYDEPGGARALFQVPRDEALRRRREEGIAIDALAAEFGLSRRSVFRVLAKGRKEAEAKP